MPRLFAAIVPPVDVLSDLERFLEPRFEVPDWRWSDPSTWHITLAFLGEVDDWHVDAVTESLHGLAPRELVLRLGGAVCFPDVARAKVLGLGVHDQPTGSLAHLAENVRVRCSHAGAEPDGAHFRAHLTLGRCNRPQNAVKWAQLLDTWQSRSWRVNEVLLVQSHLGEGPRGRPRHEVVERFPIVARPGEPSGASRSLADNTGEN